MNGVSSLLQFRLGDQTHALDAMVIRQILRAPRLIPLPLTRACAQSPGLIAWQGRPLPVLDLGACLLRRPSLAEKEARFLVWTQAPQAGVLVVDGVGALQRISATTLTRHWAPTQPGLPPPWNAIRGVLYAGEAENIAPAGFNASLSTPIAVFDVVALWAVCWERLRPADGESVR